MADEGDYANEPVQQEIDALVRERRQFSGQSATHCEDCGDRIPEARRDAIPGCSMCADCQDMQEQRERRGIAPRSNPSPASYQVDDPISHTLDFRIEE